MSVQTKPILKTYFETGDTPTQAQFETLIDSLKHVNDGFKLITVINDDMFTVAAGTAVMWIGVVPFGADQTIKIGTAGAGSDDVLYEQIVSDGQEISLPNPSIWARVSAKTVYVTGVGLTLFVRTMNTAEVV